MLKSSKGITLVALVITIIVLLILAGVTLSIVFRDGLIEKSQNAVDQYINAQDNEINGIEYTENMFEQFWYNAMINRGLTPGE